ncbi:MAG: DUF2384 domain-containing protein [Candidatus Sungbacteria bacterium]|nr:DUF2384 domain-containing protein [Candidatus Sungbacteria bacterium]
MEKRESSPRFITLRESGFFKNSRRPNMLVDNEETVFVSEGSSLKFGGGVRLGPNIFFVGNIQIGPRSTILPGSWIVNSKIGPDSSIGPTACIENCQIKSGAKIGFTAQFKRCRIGKNFTAKHHCDIEDADIGNNVNIGAGVITANYDGTKKHPIAIGNGVFIGTNANLIAPITIGNDAMVAAGSTISRDVRPYTMVIARAQEHQSESTYLRKTAEGFEKIKIGKERIELLKSVFSQTETDATRHPALIYEWLTRPHKVFDGRMPIDLILEGT